jgi:hypothetical protein
VECRLQVPDLFHFTLGESVRDMWHAEVYSLSIMIAVLSGGWPYFKVFLLIICWTLPPRMLAPTHRGRMLVSQQTLNPKSLNPKPLNPKP